MEGSPHYYFRIPIKVARVAAGKSGAEELDAWCERLIRDLSAYGDLRVVKEFRRGKDPDNWWIYGRHYTVLARWESDRADTLLVLSVQRGPERQDGSPLPTEKVTVLPGVFTRYPPWPSHERDAVDPKADSGLRDRGGRHKWEGRVSPGRPMLESTPETEVKPTPPAVDGAQGSAPAANGSAVPSESTTADLRLDAPAGPTPTTRKPPDGYVSPNMSKSTASVTGTLSDTTGPATPTMGLVVSPTGAANLVSAVDRASALVRSVVAASPRLSGILDNRAPTQALHARRQDLEDSLRSLERELNGLPTENELAVILARVERTSELAARAGIGAISGSLSDRRWSDLDLLLGLMATEEWELLPRWLFDGDPADEDVRTAIANSEADTDEAFLCMAWIGNTFGERVPTALRELSAPSRSASTASRVERLQAAWTESERVGRLRGLRPFSRILRASSEEFDQVMARVESWRPVLAGTALEELWAELDGQPVGEWMASTDMGLDPGGLTRSQAELVLAQSSLANARQLLAMIAAGRVELHHPSPSPLPGPVVASLEQPVSNEDGHITTPRLLIPRVPPEGGVVLVRVPIRIRAKTRWEGSPQLLIECEHLKTMPLGLVAEGVEVIAQAGSRVLCWTPTIRLADWFETDSDGNSWCWEGTLPIPAHAPRLSGWIRGESLRLSVKVTNGPTWAPRPFEFRAHEGRFTFPMRDTTDSDTMIKMPIGVQTNHEHLANIVRDGGKSFYIAAPRRFGKTTLMNYLLSVAAAQPTRMAHVGRHLYSRLPRVCMQGLLDGLREEILERFGSAPPEVRVGADGFPDRTGFDRLRQFLAEHGVRELSLFVDEAQSLIPRNETTTWGDRLKTVIEGQYGMKAVDKASVTFILVGTMALPDRLGRNCRDFLNVGAEITRIEPLSLARYIRETTGGRLQSSAGAREELAHAASNLWTLLRLLEEVSATLDREGRGFFLIGDVRRAIESLIARESSTTDGGLWSYVSAELSHTDQWAPIDSYPVALAFARSEVLTARPSERVARCVEWLNSHLAEQEFPGSIRDERVRAGVVELERLGILKRGGQSFQRPLLEKLLARRARDNPFIEGESLAALLRMAVEAIEWPAGAVSKAEARGGQAEIFVLDDGERTQAWRRADVTDAEARKRFAMTCCVLRALRENPTRTDGDYHLPRVRKAGFNIENPNEGIVVYDWIPGQSMAANWGDLPPNVRAHLVRQIAAALAALARRGIVHRDVTPRNIVVDGALHATLIDFGMACLVDSTGNTVIEDQRFVAPEVRLDRRYSFASDVYALGAILEGARPGGDSGSAEVRRLVENMRADKPEMRPSAVAVEQELAKILQREGFDTQRYAAKRDVEQLIERIQEPWLRVSLDEEQFKLGAVNRKMRWTPWNEARALEVAHLLNSVFGEWVKRATNNEASELARLPWEKGRPSLSVLGLFNRPNRKTSVPTRWRDSAVAAVGQLRNANAHPERRREILDEVRRERRLVAGKEVDEYRRWILEVANKLDGGIGCAGAFEEFVKCFTDV